MTAMPVLQQLARLIDGDPPVALERLLHLVVEQTGLESAFVSVGRRGARSMRMTVGELGREHGAVVDAAWAAKVPTDDADPALFIGDVHDDDLAPVLAATGVLALAAVPLYDEEGHVVGGLGALGSSPRPWLGPRERAVLTSLAEVIAPVAAALDAAPTRPAPAVDLAAVAAAVQEAGDLERLSRPLLEALGDLTGLASTYLTVIDEERDLQEILYARNTREGFEIPESLAVPWGDTLCRRALIEGRPSTTDVPALWGDSDAARELGITTYVSVPVALPDGTVWGTLCGADSAAATGAETHLPTMRLFARLIAAEVQREQAVRQARLEAATDALTGCASRRVVDAWLTASISALDAGDVVVAAYVDLNGFKPVNDTFGHAAGDAVLVEVGRRLQGLARPEDLVARLGGDEFLVAATVPGAAAEGLVARVRAALHFELAWDGTSVPVRAAVGCATAAGGDGAALLAAADAAMYAAKHRSRLAT